jgi:hypothetical protein
MEPQENAQRLVYAQLFLNKETKEHMDMNCDLRPKELDKSKWDMKES